MTTTTNDLRKAILALTLALDPQRQGEGWPDPIAWDGRPLAEQARDLLAAAEASEDDAVWHAARLLRIVRAAEMGAPLGGDRLIERLRDAKAEGGAS